MDTLGKKFSVCHYKPRGIQKCFKKCQCLSFLLMTNRVTKSNQMSRLDKRILHDTLAMGMNESLYELCKMKTFYFCFLGRPYHVKAKNKVLLSSKPLGNCSIVESDDISHGDDISYAIVKKEDTFYVFCATSENNASKCTLFTYTKEEDVVHKLHSDNGSADIFFQDYTFDNKFTGDRRNNGRYKQGVARNSLKVNTDVNKLVCNFDNCGNLVASNDVCVDSKSLANRIDADSNVLDSAPVIDSNDVCVASESLANIIDADSIVLDSAPVIASNDMCVDSESLVNRIDVTEEHMDQIKQPTNIKELESFLCLCSYHRNHIKLFSLLSNPLYKMVSAAKQKTKKTHVNHEKYVKAYHQVKVSFFQSQLKAFERLKQYIITAPTLPLVDSDPVIANNDMCIESESSINVIYDDPNVLISGPVIARNDVYINMDSLINGIDDDSNALESENIVASNDVCMDIESSINIRDVDHDIHNSHQVCGNVDVQFDDPYKAAHDIDDIVCNISKSAHDIIDCGENTSTVLQTITNEDTPTTSSNISEEDYEDNIMSTNDDSIELDSDQVCVIIPLLKEPTEFRTKLEKGEMIDSSSAVPLFTTNAPLYCDKFTNPTQTNTTFNEESTEIENEDQVEEINESSSHEICILNQPQFVNEADSISHEHANDDMELVFNIVPIVEDLDDHPDFQIKTEQPEVDTNITIHASEMANDNPSECNIIDVDSYVPDSDPNVARNYVCIDSESSTKTKKIETMKTPLHPKYSIMIASAISALNDHKGSTNYAIFKYIEAKYQGLTEQARQHMNMALIAGVKNGSLKLGDGSLYCLGGEQGEEVRLYGQIVWQI